MNGEQQQNQNSLVPSGNRALATGSSSLVRRGLGLAVHLNSVPAAIQIEAEKICFDLGAAKYVDALKLAEDLIRRYPENGDAHFFLGFAYEEIGRTDDALAAY